MIYRCLICNYLTPANIKNFTKHAFTMDMFTITILAGVFCLGFLYLRTKAKRYPPGPLSFPILGCLPFLYKLQTLKMHYFKYFAEKHDEIIGIWVGPKLMVMLNGTDAINKAHMEHFCDRPNWVPTLQYALKDGKG